VPTRHIVRRGERVNLSSEESEERGSFPPAMEEKRGRLAREDPPHDHPVEKPGGAGSPDRLFKETPFFRKKVKSILLALKGGGESFVVHLSDSKTSSAGPVGGTGLLLPETVRETRVTK